MAGLAQAAAHKMTRRGWCPPPFARHDAGEADGEKQAPSEKQTEDGDDEAAAQRRRLIATDLASDGGDSSGSDEDPRLKKEDVTVAGGVKESLKAPSAAGVEPAEGAATMVDLLSLKRAQDALVAELEAAGIE